MTDNKDVVNKIQKLIEHYNGCKKINSENEAMTALMLAKRLMRQYHIEFLDVSIVTEDDIGGVQTDKFSVYSVPLWVSNLINVINNICNCSCVLNKEPQNNGYIHIKVVFVAPKDDLEQISMLYNLFKKTIHKLANEHVKSINGNYTNWRSFAEGFTLRLLERSRAEDLDDDFGDVQIDDNVDDDEEFSNYVDESEVPTPDNVSGDKSRDIDKYLRDIKKKITEYISKNFQAKEEPLKTKTRVLMDSFTLGKIYADKQKIPKMDRMSQTHKTESE